MENECAARSADIKIIAQGAIPQFSIFHSQFSICLMKD